MTSSAPMVIARIAFAMIFWIVTYNSSELNFLNWWLVQDFSTQLLTGLIWAGIGGVMLAWSWQAIGPWGFSFLAALIGALIFFFYDQGFIASPDAGFAQNLVPFSLGVINAVALNWNDLRRGGSGTLGVDESDIE